MPIGTNSPGSDWQLMPLHESPSLAPGSDAFLTQAMMDRIARVSPRSGSEALRELRAAFPDSPLSLRVAALEAFRRATRGTS